MLVLRSTCNRQELASLALTMSWRNASSTYPLISLALTQPVRSRCLRIPLALRSCRYVLAYPPRDPKVQQWFSASNNSEQQLARDRCHAFLHALLSTTLSHLKEICGDEAIAQKIQTEELEPRLAILASEFRNRMAKGRTFEAHGAYRTNFYDVVFARANEVILPSLPRTERSS
jgi:hypothetical protein